MSQRQVLQGTAGTGRDGTGGPGPGRRGTDGRGPGPQPLTRRCPPAVFEQYQRARTQFVQAVAELSARPQNAETLRSAGT